MGKSNVAFRAMVDGLILVMDGEDDFKSIFMQLEKKLASSGKFFKNASIAVKYKGRKLSGTEQKKIRDLMSAKTGVQIKSFEEDDEIGSESGEEENDTLNGKFNFRKFYFNGVNEGVTKFQRGTIRSGQLISYDGNMVVLGDVNPGGQVEATGNVIVMGALRGTVHAGIDGNREAIIAALNLQPMQLRIADIITRCPDDKGRDGSPIPELAYVRDDMVYVERFLPQYKY